MRSRLMDDRPSQFFRYAAHTAATVLLLLFACDTNTRTQDLDVPYVPTPHQVVERMLDMADVGPGDYVIDLGSGDGRIVIAAVKRGAEAHGVDLDPRRIQEARANARREGVEDRAMFLQQNIFNTDFSQASVVTMYLLSSVNLKLRPKLLDELRPGTRVVSHSFDMGDWEADKTATNEPGSNAYHYVYFWIIPAKVDGTWSWNLAGKKHSLTVDQHYQEITLDYRAGSSNADTREAVLSGERISFMADNGSEHYAYSGQVNGDRISGIVQIRNGQDQRIASWTATRH